MGGKAFSHASCPGAPHLATPRMNRRTYEQLKAQCVQQVQAFFPSRRVTVAPEQPGKEDFGDIDILVSGPSPAQQQAGERAPLQVAELANACGAVAWIDGGVEAAMQCCLAMRWDGQPSEMPARAYRVTKEEDEAEVEGSALGVRSGDVPLSSSLAPAEMYYAQVDVGVVAYELFDWHAFFNAFGNMGMFLGHLGKPMGLSVSHRGFFLRLPEFDEIKAEGKMIVPDSEGIIFLSCEPRRVMAFFGLSVELYDQGFERVEDLYDWLISGEIGYEKIRAPVNDTAKDRHKMKRPSYTAFFDEYLLRKHGWTAHDRADAPTTRTEAEKLSEATAVATKRQEMLTRALSIFNCEAQYLATREVLTRHIAIFRAERMLKPVVARHSGASDKKLTELMRAFRRWTGCREGQPYVLATPSEDGQSQLADLLSSPVSGGSEEGPGGVGGTLVGLLDEWIGLHWKEVQGLERQRAKGKREIDAKLKAGLEEQQEMQ